MSTVSGLMRLAASMASCFVMSRFVLSTTVFRGESSRQPSAASVRPHLMALSLAQLNTRKGWVRARCTLLRKIGTMIVPIQLITTAVEKLVGNSMIPLILTMLRRVRARRLSFTVSIMCDRRLTRVESEDNASLSNGFAVTLLVQWVINLNLMIFFSV